MKKKAIFLDRDGTINVDKDYMYKTEDFEFVEGVIEGLQILSKLGYIFIVVTNQAGIARGYYTEEDLEKLNDFMKAKFLDYGVKIEKCYFCPHHYEKGIGKYKIDCDCRKPKPKMLLDGIKEFSIDPTKSYMIGDKLSDIDAGINAGVKSIMVGTGKEITEEIKENLKKRGVEIYKSIYDFAINIEK